MKNHYLYKNYIPIYVKEKQLLIFELLLTI